MSYHIQGSGLSALGQKPAAAQQCPPEAVFGLHRYMLGVYEYVSCGLALTGLAAYFDMYSGFHTAMMELTPPLSAAFCLDIPLSAAGARYAALVWYR
jgi:FtsH-binding integral membrane protein